MRYSPHAVTPISNHDSLSTKDFIAEVTRATTPEQRAGSILLVGGSDFSSVALRRAQSSLRFDLRSSYWSHAALVTEWPDGEPSRINGVEVALEVAGQEGHAPENNGVTSFKLARYANDATYPNLCVAVPLAVGQGLGESWREELLAAAANPNAGRPQYSFYAWLAEWRRYAMLPATTANPLFANVPVPGAAFVEFAYATARMNLIPGATSPNATPEHLWATLTHWTAAFASRLTLQVFRRIKDKRCPDAPTVVMET